VPLWGGTWYSTPIFNFADAAIFCGVVTILIFQNKFFEQPKEAEIEENLEENTDKIESINNEETSDKVEDIVIDENTKEEDSDSTKE
jgi:signal peptidase II